MCNGLSEVRNTRKGFICPRCKEKLSDNQVIGKLLSRVGDLESREKRRNEITVNVFRVLGLKKCEFCSNWLKETDLFFAGEALGYYCLDCWDEYLLPDGVDENRIAKFLLRHREWHNRLLSRYNDEHWMELFRKHSR